MTPAANASTSQLANAIRALAMDAVETAKSGHPGMPMGMAEIAVALWTRHLAHNPANAKWANRDRFVVSNGHGSMLLYALLHLTGYDLPMEELKRFRQLHSKTPGHPEFGPTPGVETTTGPLGQGLSNAVGMALAERLLAAEFNRPGHAIVDHRTYVFVGDGCLMEGISHEACSLAGTWGLGKLMVLYDDNGISIDGETKGWFTDDTPERFEAYGWNVIRDVDGHDVDGGRPRDRRGTSRHRSSHARLLQDGDRQGRAATRPAPRRRTAPRWARRRSRWRAPSSAGRIAPFVIPDAVYAGWNARERGALGRGCVGEALRAVSRRPSRPRRRIHAADARRAPRGVERDGERVRAGAGREGRDRGHAQGVAARDRGVSPRRCPR